MFVDYGCPLPYYPSPSFVIALVMPTDNDKDTFALLGQADGQASQWLKNISPKRN
jgi:hypothetical protein